MSPPRHVPRAEIMSAYSRKEHDVMKLLYPYQDPLELLAGYTVPDNCTAMGVGDRIGVSQGNAGKVLHQMERKGLVQCIGRRKAKSGKTRAGSNVWILTDAGRNSLKV